MESILGSVSWIRRGGGELDRIMWCATINGSFELYDEFNTKEEAMAYVEAITALGD